MAIPSNPQRVQPSGNLLLDHITVTNQQCEKVLQHVSPGSGNLFEISFVPPVRSEFHIILPSKKGVQMSKRAQTKSLGIMCR